MRSTPRLVWVRMLPQCAGCDGCLGLICFVFHHILQTRKGDSVILEGIRAEQIYRATVVSWKNIVPASKSPHVLPRHFFLRWSSICLSVSAVEAAVEFELDDPNSQEYGKVDNLFNVWIRRAGARDPQRLV